MSRTAGIAAGYIFQILARGNNRQDIFSKAKGETIEKWKRMEIEPSLFTVKKIKEADFLNQPLTY
jgi:hypothetical protein